MNIIIKAALVLAGSIFLGLGILGVFMPLLPTTPFLLLAAACYSKSSDKFYNKLIGNNLLGRYIRNYREGKGISLKAKLLAIAILWCTIGYSVIFAVSNLVVNLLLAAIAVGVTIHLIGIRTLEE